MAQVTDTPHSPDPAALWERHGRRIVTLCARITGSPEAGRRAGAATFAEIVGSDPAPLGPRLALAAAALRACAAEADGEVPDGVPAAPGPLAALVARTAAANAALSRSARTLLALRLVSGLSYEQIATLAEEDEDRIAAGLAGARLALRARIGTSEAPERSEDCDRALPLLARRQDGESLSAEDSGWLAAHEAACPACQFARQAMQEADIAYRAWPDEDPGPRPE